MLVVCKLQSQELYDLASVGTIEVTFTQANWDQILDTYYSNGLDERLMGVVEINGESFDSVGVKYKAIALLTQIIPKTHSISS